MLRATVKGMLAHRLRLVLTGSSIALGIAFLAGTLMLSASMQRAFDDLFADVNAGTDVVVRAESGVSDAQFDSDRAPVPAHLLSRVQGLEGVAAAEGAVQGYALVTGADGKPVQPQGAPTLGLSMPEDERFLGETEVRSGRAPAGPGEVAVDATTAAEGDLEVGSSTQVLFGDGSRTFTVVGIVGYGDNDDLGGASAAYFDLRTAQQVMGRTGLYDSLRLQAADGVSADDLAARVDAALPERLEALTGQAVADEQAAAVKEGLGFFSTALLGFAGIALFVGSFIIWNTFSMQVAQRTRELALLRAIGATRGQVMRTLVAESVLLGAVSSAVGVLLGLGMARGLSALMDAFGFSVSTDGIRLEPHAVVAGLLTGTAVTVLAAVAPARRATKVLPVEALREAAPRPARTSRARVATGTLLLVAGGAAVAAGLSGTPVLLAVGTVAAVLAVTVLAPTFVRPMAAVIGSPLRLRGMAGELARENAMRNPRRTASTAMALVIGLTMVAAVAVFASSLKASFGDVLSSTRADLYVLTPSAQAPGFSRDVVDDVRAVDGVDLVSPTGFTLGTVEGRKGQAFVSLDPATAPRVLDLGTEALADLADDGVLVHADAAEEQGLEVGDTLTTAFSGTGQTRFEVRGLFEERGFVSADYVISAASHDRVEPQRLQGTALVLVDEGADVATVQERIDRVLESHPDATVMDQEEFQGALGSVIDQLLSLVTVLLLLAVVIALLGIVNTLALSVFERTRELGMLRAIGMTRSQVRAMVRWESVVISLIGALVGAGLGIGLGLALTRSLADEGIEKMAVPGLQLAAYVVAAALAGVLAAVGPARRASRVDVLRAVVSD